MFSGIVQGAAPHSIQIRTQTSCGVARTRAASSRNELHCDAIRLLMSDPNIADCDHGVRLSKSTICVRCPALKPLIVRFPPVAMGVPGLNFLCMAPKDERSGTGLGVKLKRRWHEMCCGMQRIFWGERMPSYRHLPKSYRPRVLTDFAKNLTAWSVLTFAVAFIVARVVVG
jgi:hypothetical protein